VLLAEVLLAELLLLSEPLHDPFIHVPPGQGAPSGTTP
jgi:hypothetical protein